MIYFIIIVAVTILDQIIKLLVANNMSLHESIAVIDGWFNITYIHNTGAAFSIFEGKQAILISFTCVLLVLCCIFIIKKYKSCSFVFMIGVSLIVGGGIGNLIDRIMNGYVVDYLSFGSFAIFNLADVAVCIGCALILIYVVFLDRTENGRK